MLEITVRFVVYVFWCCYSLFKAIGIQSTPLMFASHWGPDSIVSLLLENKAEIDAVDNDRVSFDFFY